MNETELANFQATLLDILSRYEHHHTVVKMLDANPEGNELRSYIDTLEPRMIETAAELVKKWGKRP
jgi:hypothetical protein